MSPVHRSTGVTLTVSTILLNDEPQYQSMGQNERKTPPNHRSARSGPRGSKTLKGTPTTTLARRTERADDTVIGTLCRARDEACASIFITCAASRDLCAVSETLPEPLARLLPDLDRSLRRALGSPPPHRTLNLSNPPASAVLPAPNTPKSGRSATHATRPSCLLLLHACAASRHLCAVSETLPEPPARLLPDLD